MRVLVALTFALLGVIQPPGPPPLRPLDDPDAVAVYARLLQDNWLVHDAHATMLVVERQTTTFPGECALSGKPLETDWRSVLDDYRVQNASLRSFSSTMSLGLPYEMLSKSELKQLFSQGSWEAFHDRYPDAHGYASLSAVGFDVTRTRAMVYVGHSCGWLCGGGAHHFLEKKAGSWEPVRLAITACVWDS